MKNGQSSKQEPSKELAALLKSMHCNPSDIKRLEQEGRETPLHAAAEAGNIALAGELLDLGANINAATLLTGSTPLAEAVGRGQYEMVKFLLENGADPNAGDLSLLDEAIMKCDEPLAELLRRYGAEGTMDAPLHINPEVLERIKIAHMNGRNPVDIADELNRDQVPPLRGHDPWDYVMVLGALDLAAKLASATSSPFPQQGGCLILREGGKELRFEITDAVYGIVYREEEDDIIEFCGDNISISIIVPRGPLTVKAEERNFAPLAGAELQLRDYSSSFDTPFLVLPKGGRKEIAGGKIVIETAESLIPPFGGGGKRPAAGQLTASVEIVVKEPGDRATYFGRLDLAFSF